MTDVLIKRKMNKGRSPLLRDKWGVLPPRTPKNKTRREIFKEEVDRLKAKIKKYRNKYHMRVKEVNDKNYRKLKFPPLNLKHLLMDDAAIDSLNV